MIKEVRKFGYLFLIIVCTIAAVMAFGAGIFIGKYDARIKYEDAMIDVRDLNGALNVAVLSGAIKSIRTSKIREADAILTQYASAESVKADECTRRKSCLIWAGKYAHSSKDLSDALSLPSP